MFENLVIDGGGIKTIAFAGAIKALEEHNIMKNIKKIIGSSAGSIVAGIVALGYTSEEMKKILMETPFSDFKDSYFGYAGDVYRLIRYFGLYEGNVFFDWYGKLVKNKTGNLDTTFKEIFEKFNIELVITGTCVNKKNVTYFNHKDYPDLPIRLAVRMSMSIPYIFSAVKFGNDMYVDGGTLNNYPIWYFPDYHKTIGFKLIDESENNNNETYNSVNNILDFTELLVDAIYQRMEKLHVKKDYWKRTVAISNLGVKTTEFDISKEKKEALVHEGYVKTIKFLNKQELITVRALSIW